MNHKQLKHQVAVFMQRIYHRKLTTTLGGNVSLRNNDQIYITPSQIDKANLTANDIIIINLKGEIIEGTHNPSMEKAFHIAIYNTRKDINAIIHAHALWASLAAISNLNINTSLTDEAYYTIKNIAYCNYHTMGTQALADEVKEKITFADILILKNHGVITTGKSLSIALERLEVLNNIAFYSFLSQTNMLSFKTISNEAKSFIDNLTI